MDHVYKTTQDKLILTRQPLYMDHVYKTTQHRLQVSGEAYCLHLPGPTLEKNKVVIKPLLHSDCISSTHLFLLFLIGDNSTQSVHKLNYI